MLSTTHETAHSAITIAAAHPVEQWLTEHDGVVVRTQVGAMPIQPSMRVVVITFIGQAIRIVGGRLAGVTRDPQTGMQLAIVPVNLFEADPAVGRLLYRPLHTPAHATHTYYEPIGRLHSTRSIRLSNDDGRLCNCGSDQHTSSASVALIELFTCVELKATPEGGELKAMLEEGELKAMTSEGGEGGDDDDHKSSNISDAASSASSSAAAAARTTSSKGLGDRPQEQVLGKTHEGVPAWITQQKHRRWYPSMRIYSLQRCAPDSRNVSVCAGVMGMVMHAPGTTRHVGMTVAHVLVGKHDQDVPHAQLVYRRLHDPNDATRTLLEPFGSCMHHSKDSQVDMAIIEFFDTICAPNIVAVPLNQVSSAAVAAQMTAAGLASIPTSTSPAALMTRLSIQPKVKPTSRTVSSRSGLQLEEEEEEENDGANDTAEQGQAVSKNKQV
jgi:hypothetical protein